MNRLRVQTMLAVASLAVGGLAGLPARAASGPVTTWGYIPTDDGMQLRYTLIRPSDAGRFPVAITYGPYTEGSFPTFASPQTDRLVADGYAVMGINVRGTGCSTGSFADMFSRRDAIDGVEAIEWAAGQDWSTGHIAMFGLSAPAIMQFGPAGLGAPHLDAIAPFQPITDLYRDVAYPGGINDGGFAALWGAVLQPADSDIANAVAIGQQGDTGCSAAAADHQTDAGRVELAQRLLDHPYDDAAYHQLDPGEYIPDIHVPVLGCIAWQDDEVSSRSFSAFGGLDQNTTWMILTNGYHGVCDADNVAPTLAAFFDHFVKGIDNGFETTPHITVLHDAHENTVDNVEYDAYQAIPSTVGWTTTFATTPDVVATSLSLHSGSALRADPPVGPELPDEYVERAPSSANENGAVFGQSNAGWKVFDAAGTAAVYTTPALAHDAEFFGPGSANLWLASTASDADVQITLSEVRTDGNELYVQRGWLRASHRALDAERSTALRPYQSHQEADAAPLVAGGPTPVRVELFPFDYVFRTGSSIRLTIDTPTSSGGWAFEPTPSPALNTIFHDRDHNSQLVLGLLPDGHAHTGAQPCDTLLNQPCRPNVMPVPSGQLDLS